MSGLSLTRSEIRPVLAYKDFPDVFYFDSRSKYLTS